MDFKLGCLGELGTKFPSCMNPDVKLYVCRCAQDLDTSGIKREAVDDACAFAIHWTELDNSVLPPPLLLQAIDKAIS